ncbi:MAG: ATP-binding protein [Leptolyngbyaceae cyanobacterium MO_188.B28]|nr:ATP-binding protein [Leptolyngbyaceae cyanobacterium MO_188.B28]
MAQFSRKRMGKFWTKLPVLPFPNWTKWIGGRRSLSLKLTLLMTGLVVTAVGIATGLSIHREQRSFRAELEQQAALLLDTIEINLRDSFYFLDVDLLTDFMGTLGEHPELLTSGYLYDEEGRLLADATSRQPIYSTNIDPFGETLINSSTSVFIWQKEELVAGRPIILGKKPVGAIRLGMSTAPLQKKIAAVRNRGLGIMVITAVMGAILAQWISRSITKPVKELVRGTELIAQGNFDHPIQIQTGDELSILAKAFNNMGRQLQQTLALLAQQNEDLEIRVQQRTEELTHTLHELQETQTQLLQSEKMSSLGQLVAGVAHEINNPVSFIHGNLQYIHEYIQDLLELVHLYQKHDTVRHPEIEDKREAMDLPFLEEDLAKILKSIGVGTDRIREIVLSLRNFSRLDEADLKIADVHEGIDSTLMIVQHRLKVSPNCPAIQVKKDYSDLPEIACYPGQLNQVFMNLLANAIDALEDNSRGRSFEDLEANPNIIQIQTRAASSQRIMIAIEDNGPGIPEEVRSKVFNPFFTTKPVGKGTGLGLSISYRIITETHGGKLYCETAPGQGTKFVIELPMNKDANG